MKLSPNTNPPAPAALLIRLHNQVGAAVDVTGHRYSSDSRWSCHGCGDRSDMPDGLVFTRRHASTHANECRAAFHTLR